MSLTHIRVFGQLLIGPIGLGDVMFPRKLLRPGQVAGGYRHHLVGH